MSKKKKVVYTPIGAALQIPGKNDPREREDEYEMKHYADQKYNNIQSNKRLQAFLAAPLPKKKKKKSPGLESNLHRRDGRR